MPVPNPEDQPGGKPMVKLPLDKVNIYLTPGTTVTLRCQFRQLADLSWHMDGEFYVKGPQATPAAKASEALTQIAEPISLLDDLRFDSELTEQIEEALSQQHVTNALFMQWLQTDPGVFNEWTAIRDMFGWTNRQAWDRLFGGDIPVFLPPGMRAAKNQIWNSFDADERGRRTRAWAKQVEKNKAYYAAARAIMQDVIVQLNQHVGGPYKFRIEILEKDDPNVPSSEEEPWLSGKTHWYRAMPLDIEIQAAREHAKKRAIERGSDAKKRSAGEDTESPTFPEQLDKEGRK